MSRSGIDNGRMMKESSSAKLPQPPMRILLFLFYLNPWLAFALTPPRLTQVSPHPQVPSEIPIIRDIDGDALPDILYTTKVFSNPGSGTVIRNLGGRTFSAPQFSLYDESTGPINDSKVTLVKIDGPGDYHLFFNQETPSLFQYRNVPVVVGLDQPGSFGNRIPLIDQTTKPWVAVDLDNDHRTEFLQTIHSGNGQTEIRIWDRMPNGNYQSQSVQMNESIEFDELIPIDIDGDGDLDLQIPQGSSPTAILLRTGLRQLSGAVFRPGGFPSGGERFCDLNGDSLPDLYAFEANTFYWRLNMGNSVFGNFGSKHFDSLAGPSFKLINVEAKTNSFAFLKITQGDESHIVLNDIRFGSWETVSESIISYDGLNQNDIEIEIENGTALADFDNDTFPDLLVRVTQWSPGFGLEQVSRLAIAWGSSVGFSPAVFINPAPLSSRIALIQDFDRDLDADLILGPDIDGYFWFFPNAGRGTFPNPIRLNSISPPSSAPSGTRVTSMVTGDLNGDSILDLLVTYHYRGPLIQYQTDGIGFGLGNGSFTTPVLNPGAFDNILASFGGIDRLIDWDRDGDIDAMSGGTWRENLGGTISQETRVITEGGLTTDALGNLTSILGIMIGDLDGDGSPDMVALNQRIIPPPAGSPLYSLPTSVMNIIYNDGSGGISTISEASASTIITDPLGNVRASRGALADLNLDGNLDIVIDEFVGTDVLGNPTTGIYWLRNPGGGSRNPASWLRLPLGSNIIPSGSRLDFDGDRRLEWVSPTGYIRPTPSGPALSPLYNFTRGVDFSRNPIVYPADFDGDGDADFLISDSKYNFDLIRNPLVDERSAITRYLVAASVQPNRAGPHLDADGDGRDNQTELIFGTNPLLADRAPVNPLAMSLGESLTFQVPTCAAALNLEYEVEASTNLVHWTKFQVSPAVTLQTNAGWNSLSSAVDRSGPCGYFRVKAWHRLDQP